jgi:hypothetical protein
MVLLVASYDILPDKAGAYMQWAQTAIPRAIAIPGLVEYRAYRGVAAERGGQVVLTYEFAGMARFAAFWSHEDMRRMDDELQSFTANQSAQIWGPSPVVPAPIRPGGQGDCATLTRCLRLPVCACDSTVLLKRKGESPVRVTRPR